MKLQHSRLTVAELAFVVLALLCFSLIPAIESTLAKAILGSWIVVCTVGVIFRWGLLIPITLGTFLVLTWCDPFRSYSHGPEEDVQYRLIIPTICATLAAALQIAFSCIAQACRRNGFGSAGQINGTPDEREATGPDGPTVSC